ncbi:MAG TPA: hypothetical protein VG322_16490 [Candidatus Acidoferrales bacterium]|nr:hypothetical protein [Candidatus Acidoferrales bacterium]
MPAEATNGIRMVEFLESTPPDVHVYVSDAIYKAPSAGYVYLHTPEISLQCTSEVCGGKQRFKATESLHVTEEPWQKKFVTYGCRNCGKTLKIYALAIIAVYEQKIAFVQKFGEVPAFGPDTPPRLISLIGPDRDLFLKGRRCEVRGLGIGAFSYYRRIVENQKARIVREMARVAATLGASDTDIALFDEVAKIFDEALTETQFTTAVEKIKPAIPSALLLRGHNPLLLLHSALSDGLHDRSDEECLELAREIRLVLGELAERLSQLLKDNAELGDAVSKLLARMAAKKDGGSTTNSGGE